MIPKIIHYSWISTDEKPQLVQRCLESWKRILPDYEFVLWDADRINKEINAIFVNEAIQCRKWAFAADYVRVYAIYKYGGIWLDTDVEVIQPFDTFLNDGMFIGKEGRSFFNVADSFRHIFALTAHCFGAEIGHPFIKRCLEYYRNRHFITSADASLPKSLYYDVKMQPEIMAILAVAEFGYDGSFEKEESIESLDVGIKIYPFFFFDLPRYHRPDEVVAIHYQIGGWVTGNNVRPALRYFRRKDLKYYLYKFVDKVLSSRRLKLCLQSY